MIDPCGTPISKTHEDEPTFLTVTVKLLPLN